MGHNQRWQCMAKVYISITQGVGRSKNYEGRLIVIQGYEEENFASIPAKIGHPPVPTAL